MIQERSCHGGLRADSLQLVPVVPHRLRWWIALVAAAFALTLALGLQRPSVQPPMATPSEASEKNLPYLLVRILFTGLMEKPLPPLKSIISLQEQGYSKEEIIYQVGDLLYMKDMLKFD